MMEEFCDFLTNNNVSEEVVEKIKVNKIDRELFMEMNECDIKEIAPLMADRLILRKLLRDKQHTPRKVLSTV